MQLARISISNFRNFSALDVELAGNVVVVGENRVGKSNLLYALRLLLDPTLPDSARQLAFSDFWDGLTVPAADNRITIAVEISDFEEDLDELALLTDYRLEDDAHRARLVYEFRPRPGLEDAPTSEEDFEFICYGGEDEAKRFGHDLRRRITMEVLPALRDVEGDLAVWRRSPLRPLIEKAFSTVDADDIQEIADAVQEATAKITEFDEVETLETNIRHLGWEDIYHVNQRALYAAIGEAGSRLRKPVRLNHAIQRLMVLDAIVEDSDLVWLGTAAEKTAHLTTLIRIEPTDLPHITVGDGDAPTVRYFPDRLPIGIHLAGRGVVVYIVTDAWLDEFRVFLERHAALLRALPAWTLRIVVPPQFPDIAQRAKQVVWNQLLTPLKTDMLEELRWYFEQVRSHPTPSRSDDLDERFYEAREAFSAPRFKALYRVETGRRARSHLCWFPRDQRCRRHRCGARRDSRTGPPIRSSLTPGSRRLRRIPARSILRGCLLGRCCIGGRVVLLWLWSVE